MNENRHYWQRAIGAQYSDASPEELVRRVREAVASGQAVVIDQNGDVKYGDAVRPGETGMADESKSLPGHPTTGSGS